MHFNKKKSVLTRIMSSFVSGYRIDLYFHDKKFAIEIDENGHSDRNTGCEIKRQKTVEQELGCKFIKIDLKNLLYK